MIQRLEWVDLPGLWHILAPVYGRDVDVLDAVTNEIIASGKVDTRRSPDAPPSPVDGERPGDRLLYHVGKVRKWLKRPPGRPGGSDLAAKDAPVALLARAKIIAGANETTAIREAIAEIEANGIVIYAVPMTAKRSTVERIRGRLRNLS